MHVIAVFAKQHCECFLVSNPNAKNTGKYISQFVYGMRCYYFIWIKSQSGKQNRCTVLGLERKPNGERNPKGTEQQIQPSANCRMNQLLNIVLLDTTVNILCIPDCQGQRRKKCRQETPQLLLFIATISLHQNFMYLCIIPSNVWKDKPFYDGCLSSDANYL